MAGRRTRILQAVATALNDEFGPNAQEALFRKTVRRGAWRPGETVVPACTVVDNGCRREVGEDDGTIDLVLSVMVYIDVAENWDREEAFEDWSDRVESIAKKLHNLQVIKTGLVRYVDDDPWEVLLTNGKSQALWSVQFEVEYTDDFGEMAE